MNFEFPKPHRLTVRRQEVNKINLRGKEAGEKFDNFDFLKNPIPKIRKAESEKDRFSKKRPKYIEIGEYLTSLVPLETKGYPISSTKARKIGGDIGLNESPPIVMGMFIGHRTRKWVL